MLRYKSVLQLCGVICVEIRLYRLKEKEDERNINLT